jgi:hypothetical protein
VEAKNLAFQFLIQIPSKEQLMVFMKPTNKQFYRMSLDQFKDFFVVVEKLQLLIRNCS